MGNRQRISLVAGSTETPIHHVYSTSILMVTITIVQINEVHLGMHFHCSIKIPNIPSLTAASLTNSMALSVVQRLMIGVTVKNDASDI